jgi:hypothetical protein
VDGDRFLYLAGSSKPWILKLGSIDGFVEGIGYIGGVIDFEYAFVK